MDAFNENVIVAICPVVRVDLSLVIVPVTVVVVVFTVSVNVFDVNVVVPFVPEVVITADVVEFVVGVNVAVYVIPLPEKSVSVPPVQLT